MTSIGILHVFSCTSRRTILILLNMSEAPQEEKRPNRNSQPLLKGACKQLSYIQYYTTTHSQKYSASPREKKSNHHQPPTQLFLCQFVSDCVALLSAVEDYFLGCLLQRCRCCRRTSEPVADFPLKRDAMEMCKLSKLWHLCQILLNSHVLPRLPRIPPPPPVPFSLERPLGAVGRTSIYSALGGGGSQCMNHHHHRAHLT